MNSKKYKTTKTIEKINEMNTNKKETFSYSIYNKGNFEEFKKLKETPIDKIININILPHEFSKETKEFIEYFHRKTVNEPIEWNFYIDYETSEIIHCLKGENTSVKDWINTAFMKNRKIVSIHNHPKGTYSAPSADNFEILENEFENYEIICSENEYWILSAKGIFKERTIIKRNISRIFKSCHYSAHEDKNKLYSQQLTKYIFNLNKPIKLIKREYV